MHISTFFNALMELLEGHWSVHNGVAIIGALVVVLWIKFVKTGPVFKSDVDLSGKTVLISGGNVGIGEATAIELAKRNARVIIACRNPEKATKAVKDIREQSANSYVHFMKLDLADFDSIRAFSAEFSNTEPRLDILINNAGTFGVGRTKQGFDLMFGTNQLGPFLLTNLLLPLMEKTSQFSPVRVVNVCSDAYKFAKIKIDLEKLNPVLDAKSRPSEIFKQYANAKLMNYHFTRELNRKFEFEVERISSFATEPGPVSTHIGVDIAKDRGWLTSLFLTLVMALVARSPYYGCQSTLFCCLDKELQPVADRYFPTINSAKLSPAAQDEKIDAKLWEKCEQLCGMEQNRKDVGIKD